MAVNTFQVILEYKFGKCLYGTDFVCIFGPILIININFSFVNIDLLIFC